MPAPRPLYPSPFSLALGAWQEREGLSLKHAAIRLGVGGVNPAATFRAWREGRSVPLLDEAGTRLLAQALGLPPGEVRRLVYQARAIRVAARGIVPAPEEVAPGEGAENTR
jgi:hypothetical protein